MRGELSHALTRKTAGFVVMEAGFSMRRDG